MTALSLLFFSSYYRWKDKPSWLGGGVIMEQINKTEKVAYWRAVSRGGEQWLTSPLMESRPFCAAPPTQEVRVP